MAPRGLFCVGRQFARGPGLFVGRAKAAVLAYKRPFSVDTPRPFGIRRQARVSERPQIAPNRYSGRVEHDVTHSKQRIGAPPTRHRIGGVV